MLSDLPRSLSWVLHVLSIGECGTVRVLALLPAPPPGGSSRTHVALDGEDLGSELLNAYVEVSDLAAAILEAFPKLS